MTPTRSRIYVDGVVVASDLPLAELGGQLRDPSSVVWLDLCESTSNQLAELAEALGLHELAVEDALAPHQRPKLDRYEDHLFLSAHAVSLDAAAGELAVEEVDAFIGDRWVITVHGPGFDLAPVLARWDRSPHLARLGPSYLLYGLLDAVVDSYFDAVEAFDEHYDDVSESIFSERPLSPDEQLHGFQMRRALFALHRLALPLRESVSSLMRRDHDVVVGELYPYYQDVYDHILRVTESTDALRDLIATIVETNLSLRDYRQNQIMKKVTSWAAIIAVPTLITGWYGMNVRYPGLNTTSGAWISTLLILASSALLYLSFKRRDWL